MTKAVYSPEDTAPAQSGSVADRVSERYGIPREEVAALLRGAKPIPLGEPHPMTMGAVMEKEQQPTERMTQDNNKWQPAATLGMILGILGILALVVAILLILKWNSHSAGGKITSENTTAAPVAARPDSVANDSSNFLPIEEGAMTLEELEAMPSEEPKPQPKKKAPKRRPRINYYTTSNNLEAQERLAEMRAEGNTKARVQRITKGGVTLYQVR